MIHKVGPGITGVSGSLASMSARCPSAATCYYLTFDGTNDLITLAGIALTPPFTFVAWTRRTVSGVDHALFGNSGATTPRWSMAVAGVKDYLSHTGATIGTASASTVWVHRAVSAPAAANASVFRYGINVTETPGIASLAKTYNCIGFRNGGVYWRGQIAAFGVAPVALDIATMYAAGVFHKPLDPVVFSKACWNMRNEGGVGTTLIDESASGNTGAFLGAGEPAWGGLMSVGGPPGWSDSGAAYTQPLNAMEPCVTPTYDGSGQCVHPDVYDAGSGLTWNSYRYWMAMTPYPAGNSDFENPSILASSDGQTWVVPGALVNPIDPQPAPGYNSDTDLLHDPNDDKLYCYYRDTQVTEIHVRSSADGVNWSAEGVVLTGVGDLGSPAVIWDGAQYVMWGVMGGVLKRCTSAAPDAGWGALGDCTVNGVPGGLNLWHLDVFLDGATYRALIVLTTGGGANTTLHWATSTDGLTWTLNPTPIFTAGVWWDSTMIYRATMAKVSVGVFNIWYSAIGSAGWHVGMAKNVPI